MTDPDIVLHGAMWRIYIYGGVFMNARLGPTGSSERKGPLTPSALAKRNFCSRKAIAVLDPRGRLAPICRSRDLAALSICAPDSGEHAPGVMGSQRSIVYCLLYCTQSIKSDFGLGCS